MLKAPDPLDEWEESNKIYEKNSCLCTALKAVASL